ncbi:MAG: hypothetical protein OEW00_15005 [candidate division Zixibacteria bacterium]|nr:hypothetical protein [candidate division Zixibacteria bacterium]
MRKSIILVCLLVGIMAASAAATQTRVLTLGENNMILLDEANITLFPSRLFDYPKLAVAEFGRIEQVAAGADAGGGELPEFRQFGLHWKYGSKKPWVLGTYFHNSEILYPLNFKGQPTVFDANEFFERGYGYQEDPTEDFYRFILWDFFSSDTADFLRDNTALMSNQRVDLYYSRELADNTFGFHFGRVQSSWEFDATNNNSEKSYRVYSLDAGMTMRNGLLDWAVGVDFTGFKDKDDNGNDLTKPSGGFGFDLKGRYFHMLNSIYTIIPHLTFATGKLGAKYYEIVGDDTELRQTDEYSMTTLDLGVGLQGTPATNVLMVLDFGLIMDRFKGAFKPEGGDEEEASLKTATLPYFKIGFDADVFKWLDVRFGSRTYWDNRTIEVDDGGKQKWHYSDNQTYLGFGFHFNRLHIDTRTDPNLFLDGFNFISGEDTEMNWQISAVYEF